jgi:hypothetical protein
MVKSFVIRVGVEFHATFKIALITVTLKEYVLMENVSVKKTLLEVHVISLFVQIIAVIRTENVLKMELVNVKPVLQVRIVQ